MYTCHVYMHTYVYTCKWETFQSTEKKKGDTWVFNISVNLNSTCICTIVQGDIKEISFFFFFYISQVRTILDGILVYRVWGCWCVCTRLYWYKLNALLQWGQHRKIEFFHLFRKTGCAFNWFFFLYFDLCAWFVFLF